MPQVPNGHSQWETVAVNQGTAGSRKYGTNAMKFSTMHRLIGSQYVTPNFEPVIERRGIVTLK